MAAFAAELVEKVSRPALAAANNGESLRGGCTKERMGEGQQMN